MVAGADVCTFNQIGQLLAGIGAILLLLGAIAIAGGVGKPKFKKKLVVAGGLAALFGIMALAAAAHPLTAVAAYTQFKCALSGGEFMDDACPSCKGPCAIPGEEPVLMSRLGQKFWECEKPDPLDGAACDASNYSRCMYGCSCVSRTAGVCERHSWDEYSWDNGTCMGIACC